ncbi:hypothetical protein CIB95_03765 [Lottiidibacillus patelloidae]|uniref:Uncharacterized protein n=1 Tax=Lottiidibacillus patelloidae TaxID=2670334 RepID=A0A263BYA6_9BACI|nr:hypothetical protein [Lottiidibacillus patelloidae]OZM58695.1 hypothetical protein CIB95_03765 [Lottiidibacillus patelloidae]
MNFFKTVESWCAVGLISFFFIPWIKVLDLWSLSGVQVANLSGEYSRLFTIAFYIIPILGFLVLYQGSRNQLSKWLLFVSGVYPLSFFLVAYFLHGQNFTYLLGVYLTATASLCLVILTFISNHVKK